MLKYRNEESLNKIGRIKSFRYFFFIGAVLFFSALLPTSCNKEITPPTPDNPDLFKACVVEGTSGKFEIMTFNVEGFPKSGYSSVTTLASLIKTINPDVVAFQEIASTADFERLVKLMPGWTGLVNPTNNDDWDLAYLLKNSETELVSNSEKLLFTEDKWAFPRPPYEIRIKHKSGSKEFILINLHLKCCSGTDNENSRKTASQKLKSYLDGMNNGQQVMMLGDYNDEILSLSASENPYLNFINDPLNYTFADMKIAKGSALWWSYPSYPSHIDHILISNELNTSLDTTFVVKVSPCYPDYENILSDHRPVEAIFRLNK